MWANLMYFMPVAALLSTVNVTEEVHLDGELGEQLGELFGRYISKDKLLIMFDSKLHAHVRSDYPSGTNLWTILDTMMQRFHLFAEIRKEKDGALVVILKEGAAWKRKDILDGRVDT